jgi:hypothetical protein
MSASRKVALGVGSIEAIVLATWVTRTTDAPFLAAFAFFLLCRPGAAIVADAVANHYNPPVGPEELPPVLAIAASLLILPAGAALLAGAWMWWKEASFLPAFSYCLMGCAAFGAVHGIVMEWEDNQPGGWLNPTVESSNAKPPNDELQRTRHG